jgi:hypothetical protein
MNESKRQDRLNKERTMTPEEFSKYRQKQRTQAGKSRANVRATLTDEEKAERAHQKYLKTSVRRQIKLIEHWDFVARWAVDRGLTLWHEFAKELTWALRTTYDNYSYTESETFRLLTKTESDIKKWQVNANYIREQVADWKAAHARLSEKDYQFAAGFKPREYTQDDLHFMAPQEREKFYAELDRVALKTAERSPEEIERQLIAVCIYNIAAQDDQNPFATRQQRKWDLRHQAREAIAAEDQLSMHDPALVREVLAELEDYWQVRVQTGRQVREGETLSDGTEHLDDLDPEARAIDREEDTNAVL